MSFELNVQETFAENVARLARGRLDRVLAVLPDGVDPQGGGAIHAARKDLKKLRALLRLARAGLGEEAFARENLALRDAGRVLSAVRDAQVLVEAFDALRADAAGRVAPETIDGLHRRLLDDAQDAAAALEAQGQLPTAATACRQVRDRLAGWPLPRRDGWRVPGRGLKTVYREGRRAMHRAGTRAGEADFHEWRKQVKYLAVHAALLRPLWPKPLKKLGETLDRLAEILGQEHDLSVLHARLGECAGNGVSPGEQEIIAEVIDTRRQALQAEALALGQHIYKAKPARVERRFKRHWKVWRKRK